MLDMNVITLTYPKYSCAVMPEENLSQPKYKGRQMYSAPGAFLAMLLCSKKKQKNWALTS